MRSLVVARSPQVGKHVLELLHLRNQSFSALALCSYIYIKRNVRTYMSTYISRGSESEKGGCDADDVPAAGNYVVYEKALHCNYYRSLHRALCIDFMREERCSFYIDYLG